MTPKKPLGRAKMVVPTFLEEAAFDAAAGRPIDTERHGRLVRYQVPLPPADIDCTVPYLVLTLRLPGENGPVGPNLLALDVYHIITALSDFEKTLGGRGLWLLDKAADQNAITLTLAPVFGDGAADRLAKLTGLLNDLAARRPQPENASVPILVALDQAIADPAERARLEILRRPWAIDAQIAA